MKSDKKLSRNIVVFYLLSLIISTFTYWFYRDAIQESYEMKQANLVEYIRIPIYVLIMLFSTKSIRKLRFYKKTLILIGFIIVELIWTFLINYLNLFDREITKIDLIEGIERSAIFYAIWFVLCWFLSLFVHILFQISKNKYK